MIASPVDERLRLTQYVMQLMDDWGLMARDIVSLLRLPESIKPRQIGRFRDQEPFPDEPLINRRLAYLVRIDQALLTYFPRNPEMRRLWMRRANKQFGHRAPLAVMIEDGESGLISVLSYLDCTFAWDLTGSRADYRQAV
ncbi:DUF2384 domain-containing protein [Caldichromatium japonicum]|uniref:DUF2384 domain-containing protein n=1 Tax=Caldichromatium japonicum TaxID=2699430 RepID=A0A6G7V9G5_9GAMM|nr:antitoxin Xre/MbcA/ParS toxin-binding domain-containing protein [Caldichromatium japonicum]QIK36713.1 DUF2384 domain-containing protein [Caldichromatium japonicum]